MNYESDGYNDWYMPSIAEMQLVWTYLLNEGDFEVYPGHNQLRTSTEYSLNYGGSGIISLFNNEFGWVVKNASLPVFPIRYFNY